MILGAEELWPRLLYESPALTVELRAPFLLSGFSESELDLNKYLDSKDDLQAG